MKSNKVIKLCCVIPSLQAGGMERVMSHLLRQFAGYPQVELHLVLFGIDREVFYEVPENVQIHRPPFTFNNNYRLWYTLKTLLFLRRKVKEIDPHSVLSFGEFWNNFVLLALHSTRYAVYVSDRCQPDKSLGRVQDSLRRWLYPRAAGIVAQTEKAREVYKGFFHHPNIEVIGNPLRRIQLNPHEKKQNIVLSVGRLIKTKHHDELIKLFAGISLPDWQLVIVGADALKQQNMERLQGLVRELGAEDRIVLAGQQSNVDAYYRNSKIFAFTSSSEGFPNVIGEALSAGLPVVAFDCIAGPSDMIENGENGYLIDLFDFDNFRKKLVQLMEDEALCQEMGAKAALSIERFSAESIGEKYYRFFTSHL